MKKMLVLATALVLAAVLVTLVLAGGDGAAPGSGGTGPAGLDEESASRLEQRVAALESEVRVLRQELSAVRDAKRAREPDAAPGAAGAPGVAGVAAVVPEEEAREAVVEALASPDPEVRQRLRAVLQEENERMHEERMEEHLATRKAQTMERVQQLARDSGLSQEQLGQVAGFLDSETEQIHQTFREARRDHSFRDMRERIDGIRQQTDQSVKEVLDEDQFQSYQTMREDERERWGPPGRGRGGRGRGH